jgi:hypothetical protein
MLMLFSSRAPYPKTLLEMICRSLATLFGGGIHPADRVKHARWTKDRFASLPHWMRKDLNSKRFPNGSLRQQHHRQGSFIGRFNAGA